MLAGEKGKDIVQISVGCQWKSWEAQKRLTMMLEDLSSKRNILSSLQEKRLLSQETKYKLRSHLLAFCCKWTKTSEVPDQCTIVRLANCGTGKGSKTLTLKNQMLSELWLSWQQGMSYVWLESDDTLSPKMHVSWQVTETPVIPRSPSSKICCSKEKGHQIKVIRWPLAKDANLNRRKFTFL